MQYFLYLRRSLTRAWRAHVLLVLLVTCAISIPLCLSIIDASQLNGLAEQNYHYTRNHNFKIHNAEPGDEAIFAGYEDMLLPVWDEGELYVDRTANYPMQWEPVYGTLVYDEITPLVFNLVSASGRAIQTEALEGFIQDVSHSTFSPKIWIAVIGMAGLIVAVCEVLYWDKRTVEAGQLGAIGASSSQIAGLYLAQFSILHAISLALGVAASTTLSRAMIERFFQVDMRNTSSAFRSAFWVIYDVNWLVAAKILLLLLAVAFLAFAIWLLIAQKSGIRLLLQNGGWRPLLKIRQKTGALLRMFLRRRVLRACLCILIAVPLLVGSVLLLQLRRSEEEYLADAPEYALRVFLNLSGYVTVSRVAPLLQMEGIADIVPQCLEIGFTPYYILDRKVPPSVDAETGKTVQLPGFRAEVSRCADVTGAPYIAEDGTLHYMVAVDCLNTSYMAPLERTEEDMVRYQVGDVLQLWAFGEEITYLEVEKVLNETESAALRKELYRNGMEKEEPLIYNSVGIYFRPEDYLQRIGDQVVLSVNVKLEKGESSFVMQERLYDYFHKEDLALIDNRADEFEVGYRKLLGNNILYTIFSALLFAFFAIITTLALIDYAASHRETIRLLHMQGASHRSIVAAFVEIMLPPGILTCAAVWAIVTPVEREYYRLRGYSDALMAKLDLRMIDDPWYLLAAVAVVAVFVAPVMGTVIRELRRLDRG